MPASLESLEREVRRTRAYAHCVSAALLLTALLGFRRPAPDILHVRGIVIEDSAGRPRVLLGAPVPDVSERARHDGGTGIIVLSETGRDRVAVGYYPSPQIRGHVSPRIAPSVGIAINDSAGNERTGYGYLENGRVVLGLDYPNGREALSALVLPDGFAGMMVSSNSGKGYERVGLGVANSENRAFIKVADQDNTERAILSVRDDSAARLLLITPQPGKSPAYTFTDALNGLTSH